MDGQHTDRVPEETERRPLPPGAWRRGEEPEFTRLATFTDGVYAIALTLLVLGLNIDSLSPQDDPGGMGRALLDLLPEFIAFVVAFWLLGRYWIAHHDFYARLHAVDRTLMGLSLFYLASVAFLPFPTSLVGRYEDNPVSVIVFAIALSVVSGMETVLFAHAQRAGLLTVGLSPEVYRWGVLASLQPVVVFMVTMPFAFVSTTAVLVSWGVLGPLMGRWVQRRAPAGTPDDDLPLVVRRGSRRAVADPVDPHGEE